jgi:RES domain-containing protein
MAVKPHPDYDKLLERVKTLASNAGALARVVIRATEPGYATTKDLLTGEGSRIHGGRWNGPASFATVYAAYKPATAIAESEAHFKYYGLDVADALPRTLVAIDVKLHRMLDLTDGATRNSLKVSEKRMTDDDWRKFNRGGEESLTQAIGRAAYEVGLEGLLVRACDGETNAVWFPGNLESASKTAIRNAKKLT